MTDVVRVGTNVVNQRSFGSLAWDAGEGEVTGKKRFTKALKALTFRLFYYVQKSQCVDKYKLPIKVSVRRNILNTQ